MIQLRPYQAEIAENTKIRLKEYNIAYLAMQTRTGKTLTALHAAELYGAKHVLFSTKKKAIASIQADYRKLSPGYRLEVLNVESIHKASIKADLVIIDEGHSSISGFPKPSRSCEQLKDICQGLPIIFLSGTPSPESYSQLFHQFYVSSFSPWGHYPNFYKWARDGYVEVKKKYFFNREINDYSHADKDKVMADIEHLFLSYTQKEAGFKQEIQEYFHNVKMYDKTIRLADRLKRDKVVEGKTGVILADTEVKLMNKLHQIYSGTVKLEDETTRILDTSKMLYIKKNFSDKKIAIFYKFIAEGQMIRWHINHWEGKKHTDRPEAFNEDDNMIFVCQYQSGREGTNLSSADAIVFFTPDFSHVSFLQARDRLQHKDRDKAAELHWLFAENSLDKRIHDVVKSKGRYNVVYFRKDVKIGSKNTTRDNREVREGRVVCSQNNTIIQKRVSGSPADAEWSMLFD